MPASPITKEITLPDNWVQLQKTMISDQATGCYWSVWYDESKFTEMPGHAQGTAWLMWCGIGEDPSVNDSWCHAEEINGDCRNVLDVIKSVYGVSFHDSIYEPIIPSGPVAIGRGETWDGE